MASVASQLKEGVTAHAQSDSLEDAREICADGTYCPNNIRIGTVNTQHMQRPDVLLQLGYIWPHVSAVKRPFSGQQ